MTCVYKRRGRFSVCLRPQVLTSPTKDRSESLVHRSEVFSGDDPSVQTTSGLDRRRIMEREGEINKLFQGGSRLVQRPVGGCRRELRSIPVHSFKCGNPALAFVDVSTTQRTKIPLTEGR